MRRIQVVIREVDDAQPDQVREVAIYDLPPVDLTTTTPAATLDQLETTTHQVGMAILRQTLQAQWAVVDATLADQYRQAFSPSATA